MLSSSVFLFSKTVNQDKIFPYKIKRSGKPVKMSKLKKKKKSPHGFSHSFHVPYLTQEISTRT